MLDGTLDRGTTATRRAAKNQRGRPHLGREPRREQTGGGGKRGRLLNHPPLDGRNVAIDRRMSYEDMRRAVDLTRPAPHVFEEELPENVNGVYDEATHIIVIDPRLNERQKRCTLAHELLHWTHGDTRCQNQYDDKAETHVRKETATLLIKSGLRTFSWR